MMRWQKFACLALGAVLWGHAATAWATTGPRVVHHQGRLPSTHAALLLRARPPHSNKPSPPAIELEHLTTHATHRLRPDLPGGGFSARQMRVIASLLRCHHTGRRHAINARLISLLYAVGRHYHNAKLYIVAGYRAPKIARQKGNPRSPHKRGVACDFQVAGVPNEAVRDYLHNTYRHIGLGYYPNAGFVHLDVGRSRDAFWVDYSAPGEKARYARSSADDEPVAVSQVATAPAPAEDAPPPQAASPLESDSDSDQGGGSDSNAEE